MYARPGRIPSPPAEPAAIVAIPSLNAALAHIGSDIDRRFDELLTVPDDPIADLYRAMRHATIGGGRRLRPLLLFATANMFGVDREYAGRATLALECIHVYSLIHDDLRQGRPALQQMFDAATAILAGDCLHAMAFEILSDSHTHPDPFVRSELMLVLARATGPAGMAGGQMMAMETEAACLDLNSVTRLQALKTGALIAAAVEAGAILGRVSPEGRAGLCGYARDIALAIQIVDDLEHARGGEERTGKASFLSLLGPDRAREQAAILVEQAVSHLHLFGPEAELLREIARYSLCGIAGGR